MKIQERRTRQSTNHIKKRRASERRREGEEEAEEEGCDEPDTKEEGVGFDPAGHDLRDERWEREEEGRRTVWRMRKGEGDAAMKKGAGGEEEAREKIRDVINRREKTGEGWGGNVGSERERRKEGRKKRRTACEVNVQWVRKRSEPNPTPVYSEVKKEPLRDFKVREE